MNLELFWVPKKRQLQVVVTLSRRNLRTLLLKIADSDSARTINRHIEEGLMLVLHGESDETHYADRPPGQMALWTEAALQANMDDVGEDA